MLVLSIGPIVGWSAPATITCGVVAAVLAVVFVRQQMTFATPLVPTTYWRRRNFMFPMGTKAFASFAYFGGFFLFPLLMEQVYGYSVSQVGFISVARPLVFAISAPIAGYMTVRTGERTATLFGAASLLLSMILFATLSASAGLLDHSGGAGAFGARDGRLQPGDVSDHVQRAGGVGVRRHERGAAAGRPGRGSGRHSGRPDHSGVDRPAVGPRERAPQHGAPPQLQRCVLGRCRRRRRRGGLRTLHPIACRATSARRSGWPTPVEGCGQAVMSRNRAAISAAAESLAAGAACSAISLAISPSTRTLPAMKACMPAWGLPSMRIAFAVS